MDKLYCGGELWLYYRCVCCVHVVEGKACPDVIDSCQLTDIRTPKTLYYLPLTGLHNYIMHIGYACRPQYYTS